MHGTGTPAWCASLIAVMSMLCSASPGISFIARHRRAAGVSGLAVVDHGQGVGADGARSLGMGNMGDRGNFSAFVQVSALARVAFGVALCRSIAVKGNICCL